MMFFLFRALSKTFPQWPDWLSPWILSAHSFLLIALFLEESNRSPCWSWNNEKKSIHYGHCVREALYKLFNPRDMSVRDWHIFLGPPSISTMEHMQIPKGKLFDETVKVIKNCEVCIKSKHGRDLFPTLNRRTSQLFGMVHGDIWALTTKRTFVMLHMCLL